MTISQIKQKIPSKALLYASCCEEYYLPEKNSKCVTTEWLQKLIAKTPSVYCPKQADLIEHKFQHRGKNAEFLLEYLEKLLKTMNLPSTGLSGTNPPNLDWIKNTILHLEKEDKLGLLQPTYNGWGNPELLVDLKEEEIELNPK